MDKIFSVGQVLSHYTGVLMCDIDGVYEIANFLAQDNLFTHQLPRAGREAKPWLLQSLPWLDGITLEEVNTSNWKERLRFYSETYGESHVLSPIPNAKELHRNALEEAEAMAPGRIIVVKAP